MAKHGFGLIGCGMIAEFHARAIAEIPDARVLAACGLNQPPVLKNAIDHGRFGRLTLGDTYVKWWRAQEYYDSGGWRGTWQLDGGGALINQAIHNVDLIQWLMGDVETVFAMTGTLAHLRIEVED